MLGELGGGYLGMLLHFFFLSCSCANRAYFHRTGRCECKRQGRHTNASYILWSPYYRMPCLVETYYLWKYCSMRRADINAR